MSLIVKTSNHSQWAEAQRTESIHFESLDTEGFIHCSTPAQVEAVLNKLYRGRNDILLLLLDESKVTAEIKYEQAKNGQLYPHIYGPLNLDAVVKTAAVLPDAEGNFHIDPETLTQDVI
ncbi:DUF952 domain-containing protein [Brevibacillus dissolubilis]|uniref:DUF952 domain-containing protein n=1 Tax=Brevibacillus dissolubilis TaxID=1844116 RepID=UPI0011164B2D|nr:DUF952 domain-containing protein [Brevibacillus dissolubilis]